MVSYGVLAQPLRKQLDFYSSFNGQESVDKEDKKKAAISRKEKSKEVRECTGNSCDDLSVIKHPRRV